MKRQKRKETSKVSVETKKKDGPVQLGIIGSGLAVKWLHWPAIQKLPGYYNIVAVCDINPEAAQEVTRLVAQDGDCTWTTDYHEVLANENVEAVLISLPIHLTPQLILDAVRAGKHVLAEKPVASNLSQALELRNTLHGFEGLVVEIAENYHYRADILKAKEWIAAGRIGSPFLVQIYTLFFSDTTESFAATPWRWDNQYRGGIIADAGVHYAAGLRELGGEVEQLQAFTKSVHPVMGGLDTLVLNLRFRSGALGSMVFAGAAQIKDNKIWATVVGSKGAIQLSNGNVVLTEGANQHAKVIEEFVVEDFDGGYKAEFDNFYQAIRKGAPVVATVEEAVRDWEIIMRAIDSAESRSVILL
jgi:predicted dehydrogenase